MLGAVESSKINSLGIIKNLLICKKYITLVIRIFMKYEGSIIRKYNNFVKLYDISKLII